MSDLARTAPEKFFLDLFPRVLYRLHFSYHEKKLAGDFWAGEGKIAGTSPPEGEGIKVPFLGEGQVRGGEVLRGLIGLLRSRYRSRKGR